jgi:hypothetical protein
MGTAPAPASSPQSRIGQAPNRKAVAVIRSTAETELICAPRPRLGTGSAASALSDGNAALFVLQCNMSRACSARAGFPTPLNSAMNSCHTKFEKSALVVASHIRRSAESKYADGRNLGVRLRFALERLRAHLRIGEFNVRCLSIVPGTGN